MATKKATKKASEKASNTLSDHIVSVIIMAMLYAQYRRFVSPTVLTEFVTKAIGALRRAGYPTAEIARMVTSRVGTELTDMSRIDFQYHLDRLPGMEQSDYIDPDARPRPRD